MMLIKKNLLKIIAVVSVLFLSMYTLTGCENGILKSDKNDEKENNEIAESYEEPIKNMIEGLSDANSETFLKAFPDFISDYMGDIFTDEYLENTLENAEAEFGANVKMSYKVTNKTEIDEEDLRKMEEDVKTNFEEEITITKGYELEVDVTTKGEDIEDTEKDAFNVYEVDGKWYILDL